jgi:hypothetical protein
MVITRSITPILIATFGLSAAACSTHGVEDYCRYSTAQSIREADPESLALVLGVKPGRTKAPPLVVFRSLSDNTLEASITLSATAAPQAIPISLDQSGCAGVAWSTYTLSVDREAWNAFWLDERTSSFEVAIAFLEHGEPLMMSAFGAAILDSSTSGDLVSCGCYWK